MVKKKGSPSIFSSIAAQLDPQSHSGEYHVIDDEYFAAFHNLDDINRYHSEIDEQATSKTTSESNENVDIDMKTFAEQFLIDAPDPPASSTSPTVEQRSKRARRNIRDLPQSSHFIYMSDNDHGNIFDTLQQTTTTTTTTHTKSKKKKKTTVEEPTIGIEYAEPSVIKEEPIESEQLVITHISEAKEEPVEMNFIPTGPMEFGRFDFSVPLDNYVQNIHRSCSNTVSITPAESSTRPKRLRKRKKFFSDESETVVKRRRIKKKISAPVPIAAPLFTDAEIEEQFGERLSPDVKSEPNETAQSHVIIEIEPVPQTPIERARSKLINALERGHGPDTFLLKIRSKEHKIVEVQLAIYSTADWYSHRTKILSKIEEALRSLRVSWTKIDIRVDDFDIQICTSPLTPLNSTTTNNSNSSWLLKVLSESGPLIVHIHDRRYPQQRQRIKCLCPQCSTTNSSHNISSDSAPNPSISGIHRRFPPSILRQQPIPSLQNIQTTFFKDLVHQHGTTTVTAVTQCVLDLSLIVSVHSSLNYLQTLNNETNDDYRRKYQQIIDPLKQTPNEKENLPMEKTSRNASKQIQIDITQFYNSIKTNKANIRNAQAMRNLISGFIPKSTFIQATPITTLFLSKNASTAARLLKRHSTFPDHHAFKQQAHFTPIIELKPILAGSSTHLDENPATKKITKIISTNTIPNDLQRRNAITTREIPSTPNGPRVIRLSIAKSSLSPPVASQTSPPMIRLISPTSDNKSEHVPLVPKQINIIKPLSSSSISATKLANPILIGHSKTTEHR